MSKTPTQADTKKPEALGYQPRHEETKHVDAIGENGNGRDAQDNGNPHGEEIPHDLKKPSTFWVLVALAAIIIVFVILFLVGLLPRMAANRALTADAQAVSEPPAVNGTRLRRAQARTDLVLPGTVDAWQDTGIYARITGYVKKWNADIGDQVKMGQTLALIEAPDIDQELNQSLQQLNLSQSSLLKAEADLEYNQKQLERFRQLLKINAVSQQQLDQQQDTTSAVQSVVEQTKATIEHDKANVRQYQETQSWEQVAAPFDGRITGRSVDVGTLVLPGTTAMNSGGGKEMFHVADTHVVRVMIAVPQTFVSWMTVGQPATVYFRDDAKHGIPGVITRFSAALDPSSRTLQTEVDVPNPTGKIVAGMYLQVNFSVSRNVPPLMVPESAVIFNADGTRVVVVRQEDNKSIAHYVLVGVGRDTGAEVEIVSGLNPEDIVVTNPGERLVDGGPVKLANVSTPTVKETVGELGTPGARPETRPTTLPVVQETPATSPTTLTTPATMP